MKVMILAAGRGNRMRPLTDHTPKPLLKIDQFSIIEHLLFQLREQGFHEIVINLAHLGEKIKQQLSDGRRYNLKIEYSEEGPNGGLETGGGIYKALPLLGKEPFLVVSGDIWTDYQFIKLKEHSLLGLAHLVLVDNPSDHAEGDFHFDNGCLHTNSGTRLTYGNIGIYHPELFADCEPGYFPLAPLLYKAVANGKVTAEYFNGVWMNVGTPEHLDALRQLLIEKIN